MKRITRTQARARVRGLRLIEGQGSSALADFLAACARRPSRRRRGPVVVDEPWPDDPVELFRWLEEGARRR